MIFIVGSSRSGTTMMSRVLGNHSAIFAFAETHFFERLYLSKELEERLSDEKSLELLAKLLSTQSAPFYKRVHLDDFKPRAREILNGLESSFYRPIFLFKYFLIEETLKNNKKIPCDQTPRNIFYVSDLLKYLPEAKIINLVRDPRDVVLSQKNRWKRSRLGGKGIPWWEGLRSWCNYHPVIICKIWNASVSESARYAQSERFFSLKFEDLLSNPEKNIKNICDFLNIDYDPIMLDIPQVGSSNETDSSVSRGMASHRIGRWKKELSKSEIYICEKFCGKWMKINGYELSSTTISWGLIIDGVTLLFKPLILILMNFRRSKSFIESIKKRI
jgi:hypothetical protein